MTQCMLYNTNNNSHLIQVQLTWCFHINKEAPWQNSLTMFPRICHIQGLCVTEKWLQCNEKFNIYKHYNHREFTSRKVLLNPLNLISIQEYVNRTHVAKDSRHIIRKGSMLYLQSCPMVCMIKAPKNPQETAKKVPRSQDPWNRI